MEGLIASLDCVACVPSRDRQLLDETFRESIRVVRAKFTFRIAWTYFEPTNDIQLQQKILHPLKNVFGIYLIYITLNITLKMFWEFIS